MTAIPAELRARPQWVCWRIETRDGKPTKVPYRPGGRKAKSDDPSTWSTYEQAAAAARFDGIGYEFAEDDPYTGLDLDDCLRDGQLHPEAIRIIEALATYAERSPSGTGVHAIAKASKTNGRCRTGKTPWGGAFEAYDRNRFFTVTGDKLPAAPATIEPRQAEVERVLDELLPDPNGPRRENHGDDHEGHGRGAPRPVADLLKQYPRLRQIANREVSPPHDTSDSGWDHYLACEAIRCGCPDPEIRELIGHARRHDDKSRRADYIAKTIAAAHRSEPGGGDTEPPYPEELDGLDEALALGNWIADQWNLESPIVAGRAIGHGGAAIIHLTLANGRVLRFPRLSELFDLAAHVRQVSLIGECECPSLKKHEAILIAQRVGRLCRASADPDQDLDELQGWLNGFVPTVKFKAGGLLDTDGRWEAIVAVRMTTDTPVGIRDKSGCYWIPAAAFMRHVRHVERAQIDWGGLISRMRELGWQHHRIDARDPNADSQQEAKRIRAAFFVGTGREGGDDN